MDNFLYLVHLVFISMLNEMWLLTVQKIKTTTNTSVQWIHFAVCISIKHAAMYKKSFLFCGKFYFHPVSYMSHSVIHAAINNNYIIIYLIRIPPPGSVFAYVNIEFVVLALLVYVQLWRALALYSLTLFARFMIRCSVLTNEKKKKETN